MRFDLHHWNDPNIGRQLDRIESALNLIIERLSIMSAELDRLTADVAAQTTVIDSVVTLLTSLADQIRNLPATTVAINALADSVEAQTKKLSDAVVANTPAPPAP